MSESPTEQAARAQGRLSERQEAIAEGISLIASGHSMSSAAKETGIARTTLRAAYQRILASTSDTERERIDQEIISHAVIVANLAGQELARRLSNDAELQTMSSKEIGILYGISCDKVGLKRRWARPESIGSEDWLRAFGASAARVRRVTIELADPIDEAVNITPKPIAGE